MTDTMTHEERRAWFEANKGRIDWHGSLLRIADHIGEVAGIPFPVEGQSLVMEDRYPAELRDLLTTTAPTQSGPEVFHTRECSNRDMDIRVRNRWWSRARNATVYLIDHGPGTKVELAIALQRKHAARINFWLNTLGASLAWDVNAELKAQDKLATLIRPNLMDMYLLTGSFLETSPRSRVSYVLRRARPTVALAPVKRWPLPDGTPVDEIGMKVLAVLCMHPLGYYEGTWAGAMVPTDEVIAHLLWLRADEAGYWRHANQHDVDAPEAGI